MRGNKCLFEITELQSGAQIQAEIQMVSQFQGEDKGFVLFVCILWEKGREIITWIEESDFYWC